MYIYVGYLESLEGTESELSPVRSISPVCTDTFIHMPVFMYMFNVCICMYMIIYVYMNVYIHIYTYM
jgi:hypothetical protein